MKSKILILIPIVASLFVILFFWQCRWILLNGFAASNVANKLLNGEAYAEEDFIDYVVYTKNNCVFFSRHGDYRGVAYCLDLQDLIDNDLDVIEFFKPWYYFEIVDVE